TSATSPPSLHDALPIWHTDDQAVDDRRVQLHGFFDFFGIDLLATGVDDDRPPAEQRDRAVALDAREVAGDRPALPVDHEERLGGLLRVLVVADRYVATDGEASDLTRAGDDFGAVLLEHLRPRADGEFRR